MGASQSVKEADEVLVAQMNALGSAYNPFEFIDQSHRSWLDNYPKLTDAAQTLTWSEVEACIKGLDPTHAVLALFEGKVGKCWFEFSRDFLQRDNKVHDGRVNLITMAMKPTIDGLQSDLLKTWKKAMNLKTYEKDHELLVWDVACNLVASKQATAYLKMCSVSPLHPRNYQKIATRFADAIASDFKGGSVVVGVEELPEEGQKLNEFRKVLHKRRLTIHRFGDKEMHTLGIVTFHKTKVKVVDSLDIDLIKKHVLDAFHLYSEETQSKPPLVTTSKKTLAVLLDEKLVVVVVHAKAPKEEQDVCVLSTYLERLIAAALGMTNATNWVLFIDSNIANSQHNSFFADLVRRWTRIDARIRPREAPGHEGSWWETTTSKRRSILHGQCYDKAKCHMTVRAAKSFIIAPPRSLRDTRITPSLRNVTVSLPNSSWGSDHSCVRAVLTLKKPTFVLALETALGIPRTGRQEAILQAIRQRRRKDVTQPSRDDDDDDAPAECDDANFLRELEVELGLSSDDEDPKGRTARILATARRLHAAREEEEPKAEPHERPESIAWSYERVEAWLGEAVEDGLIDAAWPELLAENRIDGEQLNKLTHDQLLQMVSTSKKEVLSKLGEQLKFEKHLSDVWARRDVLTDMAMEPDHTESLQRLVNVTDADAVLKAIDTRGDLGSQEPLPSKVTTPVPVFQTLVVNRFVEDGEDEPPHLLGTFIQRSLLVPLKRIVRDDGQASKSYFDTRVNNLLLDAESQCQLRDVTTTPVRVEHNNVSVVGESAVCTFNAKFPLSLREVFSVHPFHVLALECSIKLSPFDGTLNGQPVHIQPDLLTHKTDLRNLVSIRDWVQPMKLDYMRNYDLVNPNPTVEYFFADVRTASSKFLFCCSEN